MRGKGKRKGENKFKFVRYQAGHSFTRKHRWLCEYRNTSTKAMWRSRLSGHCMGEGWRAMHLPAFHTSKIPPRALASACLRSCWRSQGLYGSSWVGHGCESSCICHCWRPLSCPWWSLKINDVETRDSIRAGLYHHSRNTKYWWLHVDQESGQVTKALGTAISEQVGGGA